MLLLPSKPLLMPKTTISVSYWVNNTLAGRDDKEEVYHYSHHMVLFRKIFKKIAATKPIVPLKEVIEIAKACGIKEEEVTSVLKIGNDILH